MQIDSLKEPDLYSILLFALYKLQNIPDYAVLSQLMYIFESDTLLKLCSQLGGLTIQIPTIKELTDVLAGLKYFYLNDIKHINVEEPIPSSYPTIKEVMKDYEIS